MLTTIKNYFRQRREQKLKRRCEKRLMALFAIAANSRSGRGIVAETRDMTSFSASVKEGLFVKQNP